MPSASANVNKQLRRHVSPVLRAQGFQRVNARNGVFWGSSSICVFNIRSVGSYFRDVTGWPASSLTVWLGVYFPFIPDVGTPPRDKHGRPAPKESMCDIRSKLEIGLNQEALVATLSNAAERRRRDIWWIPPDGVDAGAAVRDIATQLTMFGLPWFEKNSQPEGALETVEAERDCFHKYSRACYLAWAAGDRDRQDAYARLAHEEAMRIDQAWVPPPPLG